jgi:hypothetical protein
LLPKQGGKTMVNKKFRLGMLVMVLAFGITVINCTANKIDGTWDFPDEEAKIKFEKGKFQFYSVWNGEEEIEEEGSYTINGDTLTLINEDGDSVERQFSIAGNTITLNVDGSTITGTKIGKAGSSEKNNSKASALAGRWVHESGVTYDKPENMELLKDGTGICDGISITWKVEGNRLIIRSSFIGLACDYKISGSKLTLTYDDGGSAVFAKK